MTNLKTSYIIVEVNKSTNIDQLMGYLERDMGVKSYFRVSKDVADKMRNEI